MNMWGNAGCFKSDIHKTPPKKGILICSTAKKKKKEKRKKEILSFVATRIEQEMMVLCEIGQSQKEKYHMISFMYNQNKLMSWNFRIEWWLLEARGVARRRGGRKDVNPWVVSYS
jgi:hypothetical protein